MSTYAERQAIRDANPGVIVDENSVYNPSTGAQSALAGYSGGGNPAGTVVPKNTGDLDAQFQKMLAALASGNQAAFQFEKDKFNQQFAEQQRQFNETQALQVGTLTGQYNGQPTEAAREFNQTLGQRNNEFQGTLGTSLLNAATQIHGPQDYLQYQQYTRGGQNLMQQLFGNQAIPTGQQPTVPLQSASIASVLQDLGILPGGAPGSGMPQSGAAQPNPQADQQQSLLSRFGLTAGQDFNPTQINPARWDQIGPIGQALTKNLAETSFGYDPTDFESIINAQRPVGTAARTTSYGYRRPTGMF